jgi:TM2 domain-containing membrane protein YozV
MADQSCPQCGTTYPYETEVCPSCGYQVTPALPCNEKNPWIAMLFSFLFFGAGQAYNGQMKKGIAFLILTFLGVFAFILPGVLVWLYGMYDAGMTSRKMNKGEIVCTPTQSGRVALFIIIVLFIYVGVGLAVAMTGLVLLGM